jgi:hypothetical protein
MNDERISGIVANLTVISTRTGRNMVTCAINGKCCKAFGDLAATLKILNGGQVEITARRGTYRGQVEYSVVSLRATVNGRPVTVADTRSNAPLQAANGTCPHCGAQMARSDVTKKESKAILQSAPGGRTTPEAQDLANKPASKTPAWSEEERQKLNDSMIASWVKTFSDSSRYSDRDLEKQLTSSRSTAWTREAATRVLETRKAQSFDLESLVEKVPETGSDASLTQRVPVVHGVIRKIKNIPTTDGRKMIIFTVGPHSCMVLGKIAEFVESNASEYDGKSVEVYGNWKINERGRKEFVPSESISATNPDPAGAVTADEVQKALEEALIHGSGLGAVGGPTLDEMRAEYEAAREERKKSEQQADLAATVA